MKKYITLGSILKDYRLHQGISQSELAANLDVDIRSVMRWEKNQTLLNSEKEEELARVTFIPYQVLRNLNAGNPIPTFYDFDLRKYSLTAISNELPDAEWIKAKIDMSTTRLKHIKTDEDIENIIRFTKLQNNPLKNINHKLIIEAARIFPDMNLIMFDQSGNYSGHSVYFPLGMTTYTKIRERKLNETDLEIKDLVNYKSQITPVFYCHSITADCNENFFYIIGAVLKFYRDLAPSNYLYALLTSRHDSRIMSQQLQVKTIWEDHATKKMYKLKDAPRLVEGNFNRFFENLD